MLSVVRNLMMVKAMALIFVLHARCCFSPTGAYWLCAVCTMYFVLLCDLFLFNITSYVLVHTEHTSLLVGLKNSYGTLNDPMNKLRIVIATFYKGTKIT